MGYIPPRAGEGMNQGSRTRDGLQDWEAGALPAEDAR